MGHSVEAKCLDCGEHFTIDYDGGFSFHLIRCDRCGKTKSIGFDKLGELHLRYVKGLPGPYSITSSEMDEYIRNNANVEPISKEEYYAGVKAFARKCKYGGRFTFDAPPRCPECRSTKIQESDITVMYD